MKSSKLLLLSTLILLIACNQPNNTQVNIDSIGTKVQDSINVINDTTETTEIYEGHPELYGDEGKIFNFTSDYQFNKTPDGTEKPSYNNAIITFNDPKRLTPAGAAFEDLPKGEMIIKFEGLDEVKEEIIFITSNRNGDDIYAITKTETDSNIIYLMRSEHKVEGKSYLYTIVLGKSDLKNFDGLPSVFTAFHCNRNSK